MRKKLKVTSACSYSDGIVFHSNRHKGYAAISQIDENGNIKAKWKNLYVNEDGSEMSKTQKIYNKIQKNSWAIYWLVVMILTEIFSTFDNTLCISLILQVVDSVERLVIFAIGCYKQQKSTCRFHSAEHMILNAFRKSGRLPSLEELRGYSRFSNSCGTNITTCIVVGNVLIFCGMFICYPLFRPMVVPVMVMVAYMLQMCGCLNFLQIFTTETPTDRELHVALEEMKVWLENEAKEDE